MKLFHYHHWTPAVEETESFYRDRGFHVTLRNGKVNGAFQRFDPPLEWKDFREQGVMFRIIEMVRGQINVTFGFGKENRFDHIGFLVTEGERVAICERAEAWGWEIERGERRTFVYTPYRFKVELQTRSDVVDAADNTEIARMVMGHKEVDVPDRLRQLLDDPLEQLSFEPCGQTGILEITLAEAEAVSGVDPCGVRLADHKASV
ncbi:hypothetical protein EDM56_19190 [Brevibacillus fluminis]|uniref:VOC domain-containing protein n=1 Tax=Brevibacillus fluminis TaxID=511487 RepID=A0A3M8DBN6_9BACL|nr:hypothetical protein [Brevibacillus fluminis]RNB85041.1 hypothetical protein EDM56_19190 [Brevibacillus fluminis]